MIHSQPPSPDRVLLLALFQNHLMCLQDVQAHLVTQMSVDTESISLEVGGLLEDIANRYLDMSDLISERHFRARQEALSSPTEMASEHPAAG
jgi:hypothetical protein